MEQHLLHFELTQKIIGCAMRVHSKMRNGFVERVYQKCLAIEMDKAKLGFKEEVNATIYYENIPVGTRRVDFIVENKIVVEIKAMADLTDTHLAQAINYLETHRLEVGLLINFGAKSLQFKRLINQHKLNT